MIEEIIKIGDIDRLRFKGYVTAPANSVYPGFNNSLGIRHRCFKQKHQLAFCSINYTLFVPDLFKQNILGYELNAYNNKDIEKFKTLLNEENDTFIRYPILIHLSKEVSKKVKIDDSINLLIELVV